MQHTIDLGSPLEARIESVAATIRDRSLREIFLKAMAHVDADRYAAARRKHELEREYATNRIAPFKYFDIPIWVKSRLAIAVRLGLHQAAPMRILDLGAGSGAFAMVCMAMGHSAVGIDVDFPAKYAAIYRDLCDACSVDLRIHRIRRNEPLPDIGLFDLITAQGVMFDFRFEPDLPYEIDSFELDPAKQTAGTTRIYWSAEDWLDFLAELSGHLRFPGRIHIMPNRVMGESGEVLENQALYSAAAELGALVDRKASVVDLRLDGPVAP
jgi:hypothetical protein